MKVYRRVYLGELYQNREILFGEVTTDEELNEVFSLRFQVYSERGYIDSSRYLNGLEIDEYDTEKKSTYFIAVYNQKVIGCIRVIKSVPLPTELCFEFEKPKEILNFNPHDLCELGRFIIIPPNKERGEYLPRSLVMLFLLDVLSTYGLKHNSLAGYSFVKQSLLKKMGKLKLPFHKVESYKQNYPQNGVLFNYFNQADDPVIPIYFFTSEFKKYCDKVVSHSPMFSIKNTDSMELNHNLYVRFMRMLKVI